MVQEINSFPDFGVARCKDSLLRVRQALLVPFERNVSPFPFIDEKFLYEVPKDSLADQTGIDLLLGIKEACADLFPGNEVIRLQVKSDREAVRKFIVRHRVRNISTDDHTPTKSENPKIIVLNGQNTMKIIRGDFGLQLLTLAGFDENPRNIDMNNSLVDVMHPSILMNIRQRIQREMICPGHDRWAGAYLGPKSKFFIAGRVYG